MADRPVETQLIFGSDLGFHSSCVASWPRSLGRSTFSKVGFLVYKVGGVISVIQGCCEGCIGLQRTKWSLDTGFLFPNEVNLICFMVSVATVIVHNVPWQIVST